MCMVKNTQIPDENHIPKGIYLIFDIDTKTVSRSELN